MDPAFDALDRLRRHSALLETTAAGLDDVAPPSLCAGWSRGHVLTHLARNAEAITRMCRAVVDGTGETMYPSDTARDADIEAGAGREPAVQAADVRETDELVAAALARVGPEHANRQAERTPGGQLVPGRRLAFMRLREVVLHHVDLDAGFGFADLEPDLVDVLVREEVDRLRSVPHPPDVTIRTAEGDEWTVGLGTVEVRGSRSGVLAWLARGLTDGVSADPLPRLPGGR